MAEEQANNVAADADKTAETVATPNTNDKGAEQTADAKAPESVTPFFDKMSEDDRKSLDSFLANNGGMKAFNKWKESVSNPQKADDKPAEQTQQPEQQTAQQPAQQPEQQTAQQPAQQPDQGRKGLNLKDWAIKKYFMDLAAQDKYKAISKEIISGDILKEMKERFGVTATLPNGDIDEERVINYLDMKAATVPAQAPQGEASSTTPTADFTSFEGEITSEADAQKIIGEVINGQRHPRFNDAVEYMRKNIFGDKKTEDKK